MISEGSRDTEDWSHDALLNYILSYHLEKIVCEPL